MIENDKRVVACWCVKIETSGGLEKGD